MKRVRLRRGQNGTGNGNGVAYFIPLGQVAHCGSDVRDQMVYYIERLIPQTDACHLIGLFERTHWRWMKQGRDYITAFEEDYEQKPPADHRDYADYFRAINMAVAQCRSKIIKRSLDPDGLVPTWVRDMTILERRDRDNWSRQREPLLDKTQEYDPDESFL